MTTHILAIDQGTTSSRALVFDGDMNAVAMAQQEFPQHFPRSGWVEHDPEDIWSSTVATCRSAISDAGLAAQDIAAIGITNQRETTVVWDRKTGKPIHNAIVWQDRRTSDTCHQLTEAGHLERVSERTGLRLDPYFSATKIAWILDHVDGARAAAEKGELAFGTIDTFLLWRLTGRRVHATDATNASRTMLYDIGAGQWCEELCSLFRVPASMLPDVQDCAAEFGTSDADILGAAIPVLGIAGDQQAATIGQCCFSPGMAKSTYGTGCFALLNTGETQVASRNRLLTTIAYQFDGQPTYALEGSIFIAGAAVQWLRDGLGILQDAAQSGTLAANADDTQDVVLVPAFTGLGAPHWDPDARGALFGLTRDTGPEEFARAALESVCFQTADLVDAMRADWNTSDENTAADVVLRVDGGMVASDWTMQCLADTLDAPVDRPTLLETTALGAAWLAGYKAGVYPDQEAFAKTWSCERRFEPAIEEPERARRRAIWNDAVSRTLMRT